MAEEVSVGNGRLYEEGFSHETLHAPQHKTRGNPRVTHSSGHSPEDMLVSYLDNLTMPLQERRDTLHKPLQFALRRPQHQRIHPALC